MALLVFPDVMCSALKFPSITIDLEYFQLHERDKMREINPGILAKLNSMTY